MKLFIAEKPSLGRAIAAVLPKPHRKHEGYIECGEDNYVSWCVGHLLESVEPQVYNPVFKQWRLQDLPILPESWQVVPKKNTHGQLKILGRLIKKAKWLIHAGDPDREGQLLVDQVLAYCKVSEKKNKEVQRCLISDLNALAVKRAIDQLKPNTDFRALSISALARTRADWLYGINMTRAYTLMGRKVGFDGLLSVGRVQTPLLGLVVRRDIEIEEFTSKPFYEVIGHIVVPPKNKKLKGSVISSEVLFKAKWKPGKAIEPYQDEEGRVLHKPIAELVVKKITNQPAKVLLNKHQKKSLLPPLPFNLSALQIEAATRFHLSAKQVLEVCQQLYEQHQLITYPRSDNRYLPVEHYQQRKSVLSAISQQVNLSEKVNQANTSLKSKAWNDKKVEAHHAIIPTAKKTRGIILSKAQQQIYELIATQYLAQFYPAYQYSESKIELEISGGLFVANSKQDQSLGWKVLFRHEPSSGVDISSFTAGTVLHCSKGELINKETTPPKYFTDATLLSAMTGIARYVQDPNIRKVLRQTDGLGTEATRAGIIELLFRREFLTRVSKQIRSTDSGKALIQSLPESAVWPDMTAQWEMALEQVRSKNKTYLGFMQSLETQLKVLIETSKTCTPTALTALKSTSSKAKSSKFTRKKNVKKGAVSKRKR